MVKCPFQVKTTFTALIGIKRLVLLFSEGQVLYELYMEDEESIDAAVY
jgi:hypothetical protein